MLEPKHQDNIDITGIPSNFGLRFINSRNYTLLRCCHSLNQMKGDNVALFMGGLPETMTVSALSEILQHSESKPLEIALAYNQQKNVCRGYAYVNYSCMKDALKSNIQFEEYSLSTEHTIRILPSSHPTTIFIRDIDNSWTERDMQRIFFHCLKNVRRVGPVVQKEFPHNVRPLCFVEFNTHEDASWALKFSFRREATWADPLRYHMYLYGPVQLKSEKDEDNSSSSEVISVSKKMIHEQCLTSRKTNEQVRMNACKLSCVKELKATQARHDHVDAPINKHNGNNGDNTEFSLSSYIMKSKLQSPKRCENPMRDEELYTLSTLPPENLEMGPVSNDELLSPIVQLPKHYTLYDINSSNAMDNDSLSSHNYSYYKSERLKEFCSHEEKTLFHDYFDGHHLKSTQKLTKQENVHTQPVKFFPFSSFDLFENIRSSKFM